MKHIYKLVLVVLLATGMASCDEWLDVRPDDEMTQEDLFSQGEGYRNALNGVYKILSGEDLYGKQLTWGVLDGMGQYYKSDRFLSSRHNSIMYAAAYDFEDATTKPVFSTIWEKSYNAVANCNNIIHSIDKLSEDKFYYKELEKNMIKGEAYALRAFIQFDLLRLFAPSPSMGGGDKVFLPYKKEFPSDVSPKLTVNECLDNTIKDLLEAKELLWVADSTYSNLLSESYRFQAASGQDRFMRARAYRLHYWAVCGVLSRVYLYAGMYDDALTQANILIEYQRKNRYFNFAPNKNQITNDGNFILYNDIITGIYAKRLIEWDAYMFVENKSGTRFDYYLELLNLDAYFPQTEQRSDYRYANVIQDPNKAGSFWSQKHSDPGKQSARAEISKVTMPLLRMSEIYYIAAECLFRKQQYDEAIKHLITVKSGRGVRSHGLTTITDENMFFSVLLQEARREFLSEGQIFFMHKRLSRGIEKGAATILIDDKIIPPIPDSEIGIN